MLRTGSQHDVQRHSIVAMVAVMTMRAPVRGSQVYLHIAISPRAVLIQQHGVAEVGTRARAASPLVHDRVVFAALRAQPYAPERAGGPQPLYLGFAPDAHCVAASRRVLRQKCQYGVS